MTFLTEEGHAYMVTVRSIEVKDLDNLMQAVCDIMTRHPANIDDEMSIDVVAWRAQLRAVPNQDDKKALRWQAEVWRKPDIQGAPLHFKKLGDAQNLQMALHNL